MTKEFIPYEQALELKELGFDEPCLSYYEGESFSCHLASIKGDDYIIPAPLFQQAFRWFRGKYGLDCFIDRGGAKGIYYAFVGGPEHGFLYGNNRNSPSEFTYEEAELACLNKLIEIVKNNINE
jgi:hypothetical protein